MCKAAVVFVIASTCFRPSDNPLTSAARSGDVRAIRTLVAQGADPNAPDGVNGWPPLEHAIHKAQMGTMVALIDAGADPNPANPRGMPPLMRAAGYGYTDMVNVLLMRGADPRQRDRDGATALDFAITGVSDIDRFTRFDCQSPTVK